MLKGYAVVTRHGSIASQGRVVLSPEEHGVCHRLREPDLIGDLVDEERWEGLTWHARVLVLSQVSCFLLLSRLTGSLPAMGSHHLSLRG